MTEPNLRKPIESLIANILKPLNFKKRGTVWNLRRKEFVFVVDLQKTPWGYEEYYVNTGIYLPQLDDQKRNFISTMHCQINWRLYQMDSSLKYETHEASLDRLKSPDLLLAEIEGLIRKHLLPLTERLETLKDVENFIKSKPGYLAITVSAQNFFGVPYLL